MVLVDDEVAEEATEEMEETDAVLRAEAWVEMVEMELLLDDLLIENIDPMKVEKLPSLTCLGRLDVEEGPFCNAWTRVVFFSLSASFSFSSATSRADSRTWSRTPSRLARKETPSLLSLMGTTTPSPLRRRISMRPRSGRKVTSLTTVPIQLELSPVRMVRDGRSFASHRD